MKPATELPLKAHGLRIDTADEDTVCYCNFSNHAAYLVHAANAYPKLVEALRALMLECVGSVKYSDWPALERCVESGDVLLVELGEEGMKSWNVIGLPLYMVVSGFANRTGGEVTK